MSGKENETREILFRGRMPQTRKWAYGCLLYWAEKAQIWEYDEYGATHNYIVDSETVGQYTGLDDKNGVKIFKGDVVKTTSGYGGVFSVEWSGCAYYLGVIMLGLYASSSLEVVGNIHDNPELLEEGK